MRPRDLKDHLLSRKRELGEELGVEIEFVSLGEDGLISVAVTPYIPGVAAVLQSRYGSSVSAVAGVGGVGVYGYEPGQPVGKDPQRDQ